MRRAALIWTALAISAVTLVLPLVAYAVTADFSTVGPAGRTTSSVTTNHVTAEAFYLNAGTYVNTKTFLFVQNEVGDRGLGVCSPGELGSTACGVPGTYPGTGGGDINELSNQSKPELIRLKIDDGWDWTSVSVSSLDSAEMGKLLYSNSDSLSAATINGAGLVTSFVGGGSTEEFTFPVTGPASSAKYLYFIPGPTGTDNDYLVWKADVQFVPEPGSLLLLAPAVSAVIVSGWLRRRRPRGC